jgi:CubicO group peptidase (beta-lactamase class C family)
MRAHRGAFRPALLFAFAVAGAPSRAAAAEDAGDRWRAVDRWVAAEMSAARVPGAALAVVEGDRVVYAKGYGIAGPGGRPVAAGTPFVLGSLSKSFTAVAVMQLAESRAVELDAPVQRYLPWFSTADRAASRGITLRHLLLQTSGLPERAGLAGLADGDESEGALERRVRELAGEPLTTPVGGAFQYCNGNYDTLGLVVQAVSGVSYERYVEEHVFAPLGMAGSFTSLVPARERGLATGHRLWFWFPVAAPSLPHVRGMLPSGYLISSAEDMGRYLIAHLDEGRYRGRALLSPAGMAELHRPSGLPTGFRDAKAYGSYAMGWFRGEKAGAAVLHHGGSTPGYTTAMAILPERRLGVVVLTNAFARHGLDEGVLAVLLGREPPTPAARAPLGVEWLWLPVAQLALFVASLLAVRLWASRAKRPVPAWRRLAGLAALSLPDAGILVLVARELAGRDLTLRVGLLYFPALTILPLACAALAAAWGVGRTLWAWRALSPPERAF